MSPSSSRLPTGAAAALLLIFALALCFRLSDLAGRDLWTDEAWVALAALQTTPAAALAAGQSTPPLYLLSVWAVVRVLGGSEAAGGAGAFLPGGGGPDPGGAARLGRPDNGRRPGPGFLPSPGLHPAGGRRGAVGHPAIPAAPGGPPGGRLGPGLRCLLSPVLPAGVGPQTGAPPG